MENLKIRVNSEAESKQAKSLLESLGFDIDFSEEGFKYSYLFAYVDEMHVTGDNREDRFKNKNNKEITLPQLRDLVVLKRNDVGDANAFRHDNDVKYYITSDNKYYYFLGIPTFQWTESCNDIDYLEKHIKPIEKPMKEYLRKNNDGEYILEVTNEREAQEPHAKHWIDVPSGMNIYWKEDGDYWFTTQVMGYRGAKIIWQRPAHPEELPFIDDECYTNKSDGGFRLPNDEPRVDTYKSEFGIEPPISLNDQYAEIEKVRQSHRTASEIADSALKHIRERAETYDQPTGERSAAKTAKAFNAITGKDITESEVWLLLQLLKDVRQWSREDYHQDSAEDCIAYAALKAESLEGGE